MSLDSRLRRAASETMHLFDDQSVPDFRNPRRLSPAVGLGVAMAGVAIVTLIIFGGQQPIPPTETLTSTTTTVETTISENEWIDVVRVDDDISIVDVLLDDGTRLAVLLPSSVVPDELVGISGAATAQFEGDGLFVQITYQLCPGHQQDDGRSNVKGAVVTQQNGVWYICRPDQLLAMTITAPEMRADLVDGIDIVPLQLGDAYLDAVLRSPVATMCCDLFGPLSLNDMVVTANRYSSGDITAWDKQSLQPIWTVDIGDSSLLLGISGELILATSGVGEVIALDSDSGSIRWRQALDPEQSFVGSAHGVDDDIWYVATSLPSFEERHPPQLRAMDGDTGELIWSTVGRDDTILQLSNPLVFRDVVVLMDVPRFINDGTTNRVNTTAHVLGFDRTSGDLVWQTDLGDPTEAFSDRLIAHDPDRNILIAATPGGEVFSIEPQTGEIKWRQTTGFARIMAIEEDAVVLGSPSQFRLSLDSGEVVVPTADDYDVAPLDPGPLSARTGNTVVWTGQEVIVWGGQAGELHRVLSDGAAFDPATGSWRTISEAPVAGMTGHFSAWTGEDMIVVGSAGAAAYDPDTDSWRELPPSPVVVEPPSETSTGRVEFAWSGSHLFVWDPSSNEVARLDPTLGTWIAFEGPGFDAYPVKLLAKSDRLLVLGTRWPTGPPFPTTKDLFGAELIDGQWVDIPPIHFHTTKYANIAQPRTATFTDDMVLVWGEPSPAPGDARLLQPDHTWVSAPAPPMGPSKFLPDPLPLGDGRILTLSEGGEDAFVWEPQRREWTFVGPLPIILGPSSAVWTEDEVIAWSGGQALRWTPPPPP